MNSVSSYEFRIRNAGNNVIDWAFIDKHPDAKEAIWHRCKTDSEFNEKIQNLYNKNELFKMNFLLFFRNFIVESKGRGR